MSGRSVFMFGCAAGAWGNMWITALNPIAGFIAAYAAMFGAVYYFSFKDKINGTK